MVGSRCRAVVGFDDRLRALVDQFDSEERSLRVKVRRVEMELKAVFCIAVGVMWIVLMAALTPARGEMYVSGGAGGVESLNQSNDDPIEFGSDPWFGLQAEVGDDAVVSEGPVDLGVGVELSLIPAMPQHGTNTGKGDANHRSADGTNITMGSGMAVVEPQIHLWDGTRAYIVGGAGGGFADGFGPAYQGGVGIKQELTESITLDGSFRYRNVNGLGFVGPELRLTWEFDTPFGLGSKSSGEK